MTSSHPFLSDAWIDAAHALRDEFAGRITQPPPAVRLNVVVTGSPHHEGDLRGHIDTTGGQMLIERGHLDDPELTLTLDHDTAYTLFVGRDPQASMQAFLSGKILLEGDVSKLLALQAQAAGPPSADAEELYRRLESLTER